MCCELTTSLLLMPCNFLQSTSATGKHAITHHCVCFAYFSVQYYEVLLCYALLGYVGQHSLSSGMALFFISSIPSCRGFVKITPCCLLQRTLILHFFAEISCEFMGVSKVWQNPWSKVKLELYCLLYELKLLAIRNQPCILRVWKLNKIWVSRVHELFGCMLQSVVY